MHKINKNRLFRLLLSADEFLSNIIPGKALFRHQYHHMIQVIGDLIDGLHRIRVLGRDHDLGIFLTELFKYLIKSLAEQVIGIGTFLGVLAPVHDRLVDVLQHLLGIILLTVLQGENRIEEA